MKGKAQYSWPPCTNYFRSVAFEIENSILLNGYKITHSWMIFLPSVILMNVIIQIVIFLASEFKVSF
jgi:hypothetical protein